MNVKGFHLSLLSGATTLLFLLPVSLTSTGGSDRELLPYEPLQYLKTTSPSVSGESVWSEFVELSAQEAGKVTADMKGKLKSHLAKSGTSVVFAKGERVLTQRRTTKFKWDSPIELPFSNTLSVISVILPILFENYKHSVIADHIGKVLKGDDLNNPLVKARESRSFLDLLNKLPKSGTTSPDLSSNTLLKELDSNGKLALYFANTVLGQSKKEAWMDALLAIGMEEMKFSKNGHLMMSLHSLLQYCLTTIHDFRILGVVPKSEMLTHDGNHYLFGWWQNCPKTKSDQASECLLPNLPEDTIFSLSPDVRLYVSPSLELLLIIVGPDASPVTANGGYSAKKELKTIRDILQADDAIWEQFYSVFSTEQSDAGAASNSDGISQSQVSDRERDDEKTRQEQKGREQERKEDNQQKQKREETNKQSQHQTNAHPSGESVEDPDQSELAKWIHWVWPMLVFLFWVTISHVWVYWLFHCGWLIFTRIFKRAHIPRPKTAADAGQD